MKLIWNTYFISLCLLYIINKFLGTPLATTSFLYIFLKNHLNDFLYMPIVLTICLAVVRWVKSLSNYLLNLGMIIGMTVFSSVVFEWIGPSYFVHTTGDWIDVVMYVLGGSFYYVLQKKYVTNSVL